MAEGADMRNKLVLFTVVFLSLSIVPAASAMLEDGAAAYTKGDYARAWSELKPLAERGNPEAQWYLGVMCHDGQGTPQNYAEAVKWFEKAVMQGYAKAEFNLGVMYRRGHGVSQDNAAAVRLYRKAAEKGYPNAQYNLGVMVAEGQGVKQDFVQAYMWFSLAAASGDSVSVKTRDVIASRMTPSQIAEAQHLTKEWKPKGKD
jgi:uncharacterized protein